MTKRDVIRLVLEGQRPPYVPWSMGFTQEARAKLRAYYGCPDIEEPLDNHLLKLRQKLESDPAHPSHFRTIHGAGYKFVP